MSRAAPPPLRFLVLVVGGWVLLRAATWIGWPVAEAPDPQLAIASPAAPVVVGPDAGPEVRTETLPESRVRRQSPVMAQGSSETARRFVPVPISPSSPVAMAPHSAMPAIAAAPAMPSGPGHEVARPDTVPAAPARPRRWLGSAWLLVRRDGAAPSLAPGGILGGSQAGGRLLYRLNDDAAHPLALAARVSAPLRGQGAEAALGLDWRPVAHLPVHLLVERRQGLDGGRSAFAASVHGGASIALPIGGRLDAYAQAGVVGLKSRDLFADGAVRAALPFGPVEIGAGAWGAAQPGAARLDIGPQASLPLIVAGANLRLSADWRFRLVGDARPMSGPALTIGADF